VMSYADLQDVTVVQLCGNLGAPYSYRPDQCTMEIARRLNAKGLNFYAPLVLSTEELAGQLRDEPVIREQLSGISDCDLALYSIGTIDADSHVVKCGALTIAELEALRGEGAIGVVAGQIIDRNGALLDCSYNRRCISADLASLRAIPKRLVVVQEANKFEPLLAGLAGRLCTHLVINAAMATRLLDHAKAGARRKAS
jgi:DNA-binding transcriptional regulator LsrR (DeoR family)